MYLLDANVLMEAARTYYRFEVAPSYWAWLKQQAELGTLGSVESVLHELRRGNDQLSQWAIDEIPGSFWRSPVGKDFGHVSTLVRWSLDPENGFRDAAIEEFAGSADLMLIAQAKSIGATVVSREVSNPNSKRRILLPDAATHLGVACLQPWDVYGALGLRL